MSEIPESVSAEINQHLPLKDNEQKTPSERLAQVASGVVESNSLRTRHGGDNGYDSTVIEISADSAAKALGLPREQMEKQFRRAVERKTVWNARGGDINPEWTDDEIHVIYDDVIASQDDYPGKGVRSTKQVTYVVAKRYADEEHGMSESQYHEFVRKSHNLDTAWKIARKYAPQGSSVSEELPESFNEYVNEIKRLDPRGARNFDENFTFDQDTQYPELTPDEIRHAEMDSRTMQAVYLIGQIDQANAEINQGIESAVEGHGRVNADKRIFGDYDKAAQSEFDYFMNISGDNVELATAAVAAQIQKDFKQSQEQVAKM